MKAIGSRRQTVIGEGASGEALMLNANGQTYETLRHYGQTLDLDGIPVRTVNLEGLLLTKQTMRDKDIADRMVIERALDISHRK